MKFDEVRVLVPGDCKAKVAVIEDLPPSCFLGI